MLACPPPTLPADGCYPAPTTTVRACPELNRVPAAESKCHPPERWALPSQVFPNPVPGRMRRRFHIPFPEKADWRCRGPHESRARCHHHSECREPSPSTSAHNQPCEKCTDENHRCGDRQMSRKPRLERTSKPRCCSPMFDQALPPSPPLSCASSFRHRA